MHTTNVGIGSMVPFQRANRNFEQTNSVIGTRNEINLVMNTIRHILNIFLHQSPKKSFAIETYATRCEYSVFNEPYPANSYAASTIFKRHISSQTSRT